MQNLVAAATKRDQVALHVVSQRTAFCFVVNIEMLEAATELTPPAIARQYLVTQLRLSDGW